jgi:hypothetical protein
VASAGGGDLAVHHGTIGLPDAELRTGRVLSLEVPFTESLRLPAGVALDDYIPGGARTHVDAAAWSHLRAWRARRAGELTSDGVDLTHVWEVELLAACFMPLARLRAALPGVLSQLGPRRLVGVGLAPQMLRLVAAVAGEHGAHAVASADAGGRVGELPRAASSRAVRLLAAAGFPGRVRGTVVCVPYWHLQPVVSRLASRHSPVRLVAYGVAMSWATRSQQLRVVRLGGWLGHPSGRARARSAAHAARLIDAVAADRAPTPDAAVDALALGELRRLAPETFARIAQARRGFAAGRARLVLVPFDSPADMRILLLAAHERGVASLLVQHGFDAALNDPDKSVAGHVACWSQRDRDDVKRRSAAEVTVTGNPGVTHLATRRAGGAARRGRSVVLVEYPSRLSAQVGARVCAQHTAAALAALERARPGTTAVIRPHPADLRPGAYLRLAAAHPKLAVEVDHATPIELLLATADLCVGALSTATLQAAVLGVPVVFLDVAGLRRPWPFDDADGLPRADGVDELADAIDAALARPDVAGREAAADALGVRPDAVERVCELVARLSR